ncbi:hypothetical protein SCP_0100250 [Sparassis crispa]|uniref:Uncharacterized protein n=1 Tax=Sparassis crispa TaxID=139825 RepID=A0A401G4R3_9APHY|nr:hypothetical protein SCP_0100250 [Sparassis crispa]GBE77153.1 hypothetical protein SCP_0100250 [Sparassis crispa]
MDPLKQYLHILKEDIAWHKFVDDGQKWPSSVRELCGGLLTARRVPLWVTTGPYPAVDPRTEPLLEELQNTFQSHAGSLEDAVFDQQLRGMFGTLLSDCARLRNVISSDSLCGSANPKESFLIVMISNVMSSVTADFSIDENVLVALPRYRGGGLNVPTRFMSNSIQVPLLMSVFAEIPDDNSNADGSDAMANDPDTDEADSEAESPNPDTEQHEDESSEPSEPPRPVSVASPMSMSTFLSLCAKPVLIEESDSDSESLYDPPPPAELNAHILVYPPSRELPKRCPLPFLCVAEEDDLPLVMMAILYQRHVWKIHEPVVGVRFSKYHTSISFYIGWLDENVDKEGSLPRVHIGSLGRDGSLDLASLEGAFALCRAALALQGLVARTCTAAEAAVTLVAEEIQDDSISMWRLDTGEGVHSVDSPEGQYDRIEAWAEGLAYKYPATTMIDSKKTARKARKEGTSDSSVPSIGSTNSTDSTPSSLSMIAIPEEVELEQKGESQGSKKSVYKPMSFSSFAAEAAKKGKGALMHDYLFDRRVVLSALCCNPVIFSLYEIYAGDVWPLHWKTLDDMPSVDPSLEPFRQELFAQAQQHHELSAVAPRDVPVEVLPLLEGSLSLILAVAKRAQGKARSVIPPSESVWRHDFDSLIFDFFTNALNGANSLYSPSSCSSDAPKLQLPDDDRVIPSTERMIYLPKTIGMDQRSAGDLFFHIGNGLSSGETYDEMLRQRIGPNEDLLTEAGDLERRAHLQLLIHGNDWLERRDWDGYALERLKEDPYRAICDALGTVSIDLPVRRESLAAVQLVATGSPKAPYIVGAHEDKESMSRANALNGTISLYPRSSLSSDAPRLQLPEDNRVILSTERMIYLPKAVGMDESSAEDLYLHIGGGLNPGETYEKMLSQRIGRNEDLLREARVLERKARLQLLNHGIDWLERRNWDRYVLERLKEDPYRAICDALGTVSIDLPVRRESLAAVQLVATGSPKAPYIVGMHESKESLDMPDGTSSGAAPTIHLQQRLYSSAPALETVPEVDDSDQALPSNPGIPHSTGKVPPPANSPNIDLLPTRDYAIAASSVCDTDRLYKNAEARAYLDENLEAMSKVLTAGQTKNAQIKNPAVLELPMFMMEYKKQDTDIGKGENQHRLACASAATFLDVLGLTKKPVFSGLTDGPRVALAAAWSNDGFIEIFERQTRTMDISTALGAFQFVSVLARLAIIYSKDLVDTFNKVSKPLLIKQLDDREFEKLDSKLQWKQPTPPKSERWESEDATRQPV